MSAQAFLLGRAILSEVALSTIVKGLELIDIRLDSYVKTMKCRKRKNNDRRECCKPGFTERSTLF